VVKRGRTPVLTADQARQLLDSIDMRTSSDLRDRALIALMIYKLRRRWLALDAGDDHQAAVR
jgi:integrase/recombinase XerD